MDQSGTTPGSKSIESPRMLSSLSSVNINVKEALSNSNQTSSTSSLHSVVAPELQLSSTEHEQQKQEQEEKQQQNDNDAIVDNDPLSSANYKSVSTQSTSASPSSPIHMLNQNEISMTIEEAPNLDNATEKETKNQKIVQGSSIIQSDEETKQPEQSSALGTSAKKLPTPTPVVQAIATQDTLQVVESNSASTKQSTTHQAQTNSNSKVKIQKQPSAADFIGMRPLSKSDERDMELVNYKNRKEHKIDKSKPPLHVNLDVELYNIDTIRHWFEVVGFVRFVFYPDSDLVKELKISQGEGNEEIILISKMEEGKYYNVSIGENGPNGILPLNLKYMFYNSIKEEVIYKDVFIDKIEIPNDKNSQDNTKTKRLVATINIRFKARLQQRFDISKFPFDRQYLGLKVNVRETFDLLVTKTNIDYYFQRQKYCATPFACKVAYSLSDFKHVAAFADLAPKFFQEVEKNDEKENDDKQSEDKKEGKNVEEKQGKPLYFIVMDRKASFYYQSYIIPLIFLLVSLLLILVMNPVNEDSEDAFGNRVNAILSLFIALVGMKYVILQGLSEGEEQTIIDEMLNTSFVFVLIVMIETMCYALFADINTTKSIMERSVRIPDLVIFILIFIYIIRIQLGYFFPHLIFGVDNYKIKPPFTKGFENDDALVGVIETFHGREAKNRYETSPYNENGVSTEEYGLFQYLEEKEEKSWINIARRLRQIMPLEHWLFKPCCGECVCKCCDKADDKAKC